MKEQQIDSGALMILKNTKHRLTKQQYRTLRGQVLAGDPNGAMKGLRNILQRRAERIKEQRKGANNDSGGKAQKSGI